ncbi:SIS domain-containing protein [Sphingomonas sp.]|uniref:SIS domain-containing protein n=1 Tax=Sphingomonas sp. TaxID=28214 RepID=UPI0025DAE68A|nr:SIS domain-containing protein [Sphingomonas sp.]MBV9529042.1 SIS domain-containing protein [Sphingomonas sp.]
MTDRSQATAASTTEMFREAAESGDAVARQARDAATLKRIGQRLRERAPAIVLTCARGSSDHAATFAKYAIETRVGVPVVSAAPSVASVYASSLRVDGAACIAISQSGKSPDLLATVASLKAGGAWVLALVNDTGSPLADLADEVLDLAAGPERSVAATKSFIASLSAIARVVAEWADDAELRAALDGLPSQLAGAWALDWSVLAEELAGATDLYVLGRGVGFAVAQEAALKLKETSQLHAEAFSTAELRHGPMALVRPGFPALMFSQSDETERNVQDTAAALLERGARVFLAGAEAADALRLPAIRSTPLLEPILQIQSFYRAADALARARGLDPDRPPHLAKVTETR